MTHHRCYGGDYNPEQWPWPPASRTSSSCSRPASRWSASGSSAGRSWSRARASTSSAGSTTSSTGSTPAGIKVTLATATASPPPWLTRKHPEFLPCWRTAPCCTRAAGRRTGCRRAAYREYVLRMTRDDGGAVRGPPGAGALARGQRAGCHVPHDFSDDAAAAFRRWLEDRYGTVEALNAAGAPRSGRSGTTTSPRCCPAQRPDVPEPDAAAGLRAVLLGRAAGALPRAADVLREVTPNVPDDHQPHALHGHEVDGLLLLGRRPRRHRQRPLHACPRPGGPRRARVQRGPHARGGRR